MKFIKRTSTFSRTLGLPLLFLSGISRWKVCCLAWNGLQPPFFSPTITGSGEHVTISDFVTTGVGFHQLQLQRRKQSSDQKAPQDVVGPSDYRCFSPSFPAGNFALQLGATHRLLSFIEDYTSCGTLRHRYVYCRYLWTVDTSPTLAL